MIRFFLVAAFFSTAAFAANPDAITPDGGRYYGPLVNGKLQGTGRLEYANGTVYEGEFRDGLMSGKGRAKFGNGNSYEGEFRDGLMSGRGKLDVPGRETYEGEFKLDWPWGKGEIKYPDGRSYRGDFVRGDYDGKGRFSDPNGEVYEGEFQKGDFTGKGRHSYKDGAYYEGGFRKWRFHGPGRFVRADGDVWEGTFTDGQISGKGKFSGRSGVYEGEFRAWQYHGQGVLRLPNGDVYEGGFENGLYEGKGTLTFAKPKPDGRKQESGVWRYGYLPREEERAKTAANVETALYAQKELLQKALAALQPREAGKINLWLVAVAGDGKQEVFRREVEFVQKEFAARFGTAGRSVVLVNSRNTVATAPMATQTSLRDTLKAVAARMDREEDILFLFLTSHGSREHELTFSQNGMALPDLPAKTLAAMLKESGIRWKVVVVSACYSGGFVPPLRDERTLVITAARADRTSFGCADENDFTYFGRAYFKESLPKTGSFQHAFRQAEILVREWERKDAADAAKAAGGKADKDSKDHESLPQMAAGEAIEAHLKRWWAQSPR